MSEQDVKHRILVVDDEPSVREFVERALHHFGYEVMSATDGNSALEILAKEPAFDVVLTDIVMPDLDGVSLALKIARDFPNTKIMMMSGYVQQRQRAYNLEKLVEDVLSKPFSIEDLCDRVDKVVKGERKEAS